MKKKHSSVSLRLFINGDIIKLFLMRYIDFEKDFVKSKR